MDKDSKAQTSNASRAEGLNDRTDRVRSSGRASKKLRK
jgi:hypothetical protein